jgi:dTMP kinase
VFIVVEGIEGSGKSTLVAGLADRLGSEGRDVLVTREPGGTPVGDAVREIFLNRSIPIAPMTEALLVNAARAEHVEEVIRPALGAGRIVLCDRFVDSTLAYQGYGRGLDLELVRAICAIATAGLAPALVLLLDLAVGVARDRLRGRPAAVDRIESEDDGFHERVRHGFIALAKDSPSHRVLDATLAPDQLLDTALYEVRAALVATVS